MQSANHSASHSRQSNYHFAQVSQRTSLVIAKNISPSSETQLHQHQRVQSQRRRVKTTNPAKLSILPPNLALSRASNPMIPLSSPQRPKSGRRKNDALVWPSSNRILSLSMVRRMRALLQTTRNHETR